MANLGTRSSSGRAKSWNRRVIHVRALYTHDNGARYSDRVMHMIVHGRRRALMALVCILVVIAVSSVVTTTSTQRAVVLVSIDGLMPGYVTEADRYGLKIPTLRRIMREGAHASGVR